MSEEKPSQLNEALFNLKAELKAVAKTSKNPFFKSNYADLNAHLDVIEPLLHKHSLILTQQTKTNGQFNVQETCLTHRLSGEVLVSSLALPTTDDMQKLGGAITYARRYTLSAALGMKAEDDDGNTATGKGVKKKVSRKVASNDDF